MSSLNHLQNFLLVVLHIPVYLKVCDLCSGMTTSNFHPEEGPLKIRQVWEELEVEHQSEAE